MFPCTKCGLCCKQLNSSDVYSELHRGDGVCINLNLDSNLCEIYESRPLICRIIEAKEIMFPDLDMGVYIKINNNYCLDKKKEFGIFEN
ncbi:MAG: YkgJ family cysteine cluster protein [Giesbergeria sp.]|nr:YkgJ family cysteine cluster protein [Giesbergeria sp.]